MVDKNDLENRNYHLNPAMILNFVKVKILGESPVHNTCVSCRTAKKDVTLQANPYEAEINEDYTPHYLCDKCYDYLGEDI